MDDWWAATNGGGNGLVPFPRPPLFLQKDGRNQRIQGDLSGDGSSRQTIDRTQVGPEVGRHQMFAKPANSNSTPAASTT